EPERSEIDATVQPVYPIDVKPLPEAERFCQAVYDLPVRRRAACCQAPPGIALTSECVRMLSAALRSGAVSLETKDVDACAAAMVEARDVAAGGAGMGAAPAGCDWVGPGPVDLPEACAGVIRGTLATGAVCRSTLECRDPLRCSGVGPTRTGVCGVAKRDGSPCGKVVDPLLDYARQNAVDAARAECAGWCDPNHCGAAAPAGAACARDEACGGGKRCAGGVCVEGAAGAEGQACTAACAPGLRCLGGLCAKPKGAGAPCAADAECLGGCLKEKGAAAGTCAA